MPDHFGYALAVAYLWIQGGLGWVYQHEAHKKVTLTPFGKLVVVALSPLMSAVSLTLMALERIGRKP